MKRNEALVLQKGNPVRIGLHWNHIEYDGIKDGNYVFYFDDCKISIPLERAKCVEINRYLFEVAEVSQETISLKSLGLKKKAARNTYKG